MPARAATTQDVPTVTACLTSAFFEDPLWGPWSFPDADTRPTALFRLLEAWVQAGVRHRWVRMSAQVEAAALWLPPGVPEMTAAEEQAFQELLLDLFGARTEEMLGVMDQFDQHHPHEEPHYYLSLWGTDRGHAGHGHGTALLEDNLAEIDSQHMPAYLESTNPVNLPRYEALGFRPRAEFSYAASPVITTMWRAAR
jgi:GNAT superfamily N-acetyltransferase